MHPDAELLRRYVEDRSEAAFAELVQRHLNLVYFAALRQVGGDEHRAKEVAQMVFIALARKAAALQGHTLLAAWLHTSTRFAAAKLRRTDSFRQQRERELMTMNACLPDSGPAADWDRLRPMIDDVLHELDGRDREAVLLRFFENRPFAEIGAALRLSEDAARMRVERALDKLRVALVRRGVNSTSAALATVFAGQASIAAPAGLANVIAAGIVAEGVSLGAGVVGGFFMSKITVIVAGIVAAGALVLLLQQSRRAILAEAELADLASEHARLNARLRDEQQRATRAVQDLAALQREIDGLKAQPSTIVTAPAATAQVVIEQQKAILTNLRKITAAADQFVVQYRRLPASLDEIVGPTKFIKELQPVDGEDYAAVPLVPWLPQMVTTASGLTIVNDMAGPNTTRPEPSAAMLRAVDLARRIEPAYKKALQSYSAAQGRFTVPSNEKLIPYFATAQEGADFVEFIEAQKAASRPR